MLNENSILQDRISNINKTMTIAELLGISKRFKKRKHNKDDHSTYVSPLLWSFNSTEKDPNLDVLVSELVNYRKSLDDNKVLLSKSKDLSSKNSLFYYLEKNLLEISYISNKQKRNERIKNLYDWYKNQIKLDEDLRTIHMKSTLEKGQIDELEEMKKANEKEEIVDDSNHRNLELINKKMLNQFERKRLRGASNEMSYRSSSNPFLFSGLGIDQMIETLSMSLANSQACPAGKLMLCGL